MDSTITLEPLSLDGGVLIETLKSGKMAAARSEGHFLYIVEEPSRYLLFSHDLGSPSGGRKTMEKDERGQAIVRSFAKMAEAMFAVGFTPEMDLYGVMASAEEAIMSTFPPTGKTDGDIEFFVPEAAPGQ